VLDEERVAADALPARGERFARSQAGVGERAEQGAVVLPKALERVCPDLLDERGTDRADRALPPRLPDLHRLDGVAREASEQLAVAHGAREHHQRLLRDRGTDAVIAKVSLERDDLRRLDVADRNVAETRQQMTVDAGRVRLRRVDGHGALDVVGPPALDRLSQRLGPGVDRVVAASLAQILDLAVAGIRLTAGPERLAALLAGRVAPEDFVGHLAGRARADVDAHRPNIVLAMLVEMLGCWLPRSHR